jgi:hypothetical protein
MIAGATCEVRLTAVHVEQADGASHVDAVEGTHWCPSRERAWRSLAPTKARDAEETAETAIDVVEITAYDQRCVMVQASERMASKELLQLGASFELREAQVHVEEVNSAIGVVVPNTQLGVEDTALFAPTDREVDVVGSHQRPPAQNGVAILTAPANLDVGEPCAVLEPEEVAEQFDLPVAARPARAFIHLLEEDQVGVVVGDSLAHPLGPVAAVDAPDALVDVVAEDTELHAVDDSAGD